MFHDITCCITDCLVRYCTRDVQPVIEEVDGGPEAALEEAAETEGTFLPDGRFVQLFLGIDEAENGYVAQFMTDGECDDADS
jgi:hypothetical protein